MKRHGLVRGAFATAMGVALTVGGLMPQASSAAAGEPVPGEVVVPAAPRPNTVPARTYLSAQSRDFRADSAGAEGVFYAQDGKVAHVRYADGRSTPVSLPTESGTTVRGTGADTLAFLRDGEVELRGADGSSRRVTVPEGLKTAAVFGSAVVAYEPVTQPDGRVTAESMHLLSPRPDGTTRDLPLSDPAGHPLGVFGGDGSGLVVAAKAQDGQRRFGIASTETGRVEAVTPPIPETFSRVKLSPEYLAAYSPDGENHKILLFLRSDLSAPYIEVTLNDLVYPGNAHHDFAVVGDWLAYVNGSRLQAVPITGGPVVTLLSRIRGGVAAGPDGTAAIVGGSDAIDWGVRRITADATGEPVPTLVKRLPRPARIQGLALAQGQLSVVDDSAAGIYASVRSVSTSGTPTYGDRSWLTGSRLADCAATDIACAEYRALGDGRFVRQQGSRYVIRSREADDNNYFDLGAGRLVDVNGDYLVHASADATGEQQVYSLRRWHVIGKRPAGAAALWGSWLWKPGAENGRVTAEDLATGKQVQSVDTGAPCVPRELQAVGRWLYWSCGADGPAGVYDRTAKTSLPVPAGEALLGDGYVVTHDAAVGQLVLTGADSAHPVSRVIGSLPGTGVSQRHIRWSVDRFGGHVAYADADERVHIVPTGIDAQPLSVLSRNAGDHVEASENGWETLRVLFSKPVGGWSLTARHATTGKVSVLDSGTEARGRVALSWTGRDKAGNLMPNGQYTWTLDAPPADGVGPAVRQTGSVVLTHGLSTATSRFRVHEPLRAMDTRTGTGVRKGKVGTGGTVTLRIPERDGLLPADQVTAVAMNVTATNPTASTYISVYPAGTARSSASNLNVPAGATVPNTVVVPVKDGKVTFYNHAGSVDLIADISGYYTEADGSLYEPLRPTRLLDTRSGLGARKAKVQEHTTVPLTVSGRGGVPTTDVTAVVLNVTATDPTTSTVVSVVPSEGVVDWRGPSNLNMTSGQTVSNLVVAPVRDGEIYLYNHSGSVDLIADVAGYYTSSNLGSLYQPLAPTRAMDTRYGTGVAKGKVGSGDTVTLQVAGRGGVPATGVTAVVLNVTATNATSSTFLSVYPSGTARTSASTMNPTAGRTVAGLVVVPVADGKVTFYNHAGTVDLIADVQGFYAT
ncbi:hypothetical protein [Streptomyces sp. MH13]|uniref:hypothetical protein n=1 Tax=Streptomyces sp. MH13 TaxID=3417651 RepID=UPI003CFB4AEE